MKKGDIVMIYQKSQFMEHPEGKAELLRRLGNDERTSREVWEVKFVDNGDIVTRFIKKM